MSGAYKEVWYYIALGTARRLFGTLSPQGCECARHRAVRLQPRPPAPKLRRPRPPPLACLRLAAASAPPQPPCTQAAAKPVQRSAQDSPGHCIFSAAVTSMKPRGPMLTVSSSERAPLGSPLQFLSRRSRAPRCALAASRGLRCLHLACRQAAGGLRVGGARRCLRARGLGRRSGARCLMACLCQRGLCLPQPVGAMRVMDRSFLGQSNDAVHAAASVSMSLRPTYGSALGRVVIKAELALDHTRLKLGGTTELHDCLCHLCLERCQKGASVPPPCK